MSRKIRLPVFINIKHKLRVLTLIFKHKVLNHIFISLKKIHFKFCYVKACKEVNSSYFLRHDMKLYNLNSIHVYFKRKTETTIVEM